MVVTASDKFRGPIEIAALIGPATIHIGIEVVIAAGNSGAKVDIFPRRGIVIPHNIVVAVNLTIGFPVETYDDAAPTRARSVSGDGIINQIDCSCLSRGVDACRNTAAGTSCTGNVSDDNIIDDCNCASVSGIRL